ncbi:MAG: hypothetical protein KAI83_00445 [Thiomargarita sp.]|nr:hypothetical protein [Thiomargarita sp.]
MKRFQVLHDVLAKDHARLELGICTLQNEHIQYQHSFDVYSLLSDDWQRQPPIGGLGIAFFRPSPLFLPQYGVMPLYLIGHIAVAYLGVIDNLSQIREKLISDGVQFDTTNGAETLSLLFHHYLEYDHLSPIDAMKVMMTKLKGQFALMALVTEGKWLMVGCRDYPLAVGRMRNDSTVYFCTDTKTLFQFTPSMTSVEGNPKPRVFCGTIPQSDDILLSDSF